MKKLITLLTAFTLMTVLTACGDNSPRQSGQNNENSSITGNYGDTEAMAECSYLYGKVTKITGNEIELALAKMPEDDTAGGEEDGKESGGIPDGAMVATTPAATIDPNDMVDENMEYTGETLTLTIPTGVAIDRMGQESTIAALKKGSLVSITIDNLEDMNISSVSILS